MDRPSARRGGIFDDVRQIANPQHAFIDKIAPLLSTPYEKTLFVDTDTLFLEPVTELWPLLDRFDFCICHAPWRETSPEHYKMPDVPIAFPELNSGVVAYRSCSKTLALIRAWERRYSSQLSSGPAWGDQPALRKELYQSDLRLSILPPEYNTRTVFPVFRGGNIKAKILHGREPSLTRAAALVNVGEGVRVFNFTQPPLWPRALSFLIGMLGLKPIVRRFRPQR